MHTSLKSNALPECFDRKRLHGHTVAAQREFSLLTGRGGGTEGEGGNCDGRMAFPQLYAAWRGYRDYSVNRKCKYRICLADDFCVDRHLGMFGVLVFSWIYHEEITEQLEDVVYTA